MHSQHKENREPGGEMALAMAEAYSSKQAKLHPTAMRYADVAWNLEYLRCKSELGEFLVGEALKRAESIDLTKKDEQRVINFKEALQKDKIVAMEEFKALQDAVVEAKTNYCESRISMNLPPLEPQFHIDPVDNPKLLKLKKRFDVVREALHMSSLTISAQHWTALNLNALGRRKLYEDSELVSDFNESLELPSNYRYGIGTPTEDFEMAEAGHEVLGRNILFAGCSRLFAVLKLGMDGFPNDGALNETYDQILGNPMEGGLPLPATKGEDARTASEDAEMEDAESGPSQAATVPKHPAPPGTPQAAMLPTAAAASNPSHARLVNPYSRATPYAPTPQAKNPALDLKWHLVKGNPPPTVTALAWDRAFKNAYARRFIFHRKDGTQSMADNASGVTRDKAILQLIKRGALSAGFVDANP